MSCSLLASYGGAAAVCVCARKGDFGRREGEFQSYSCFCRRRDPFKGEREPEKKKAMLSRDAALKGFHFGLMFILLAGGGVWREEKFGWLVAPSCPYPHPADTEWTFSSSSSLSLHSGHTHTQWDSAPKKMRSQCGGMESRERKREFFSIGELELPQRFFCTEENVPNPSLCTVRDIHFVRSHTLQQQA